MNARRDPVAVVAIAFLVGLSAACNGNSIPQNSSPRDVPLSCERGPLGRVCSDETIVINEANTVIACQKRRGRPLRSHAEGHQMEPCLRDIGEELSDCAPAIMPSEIVLPRSKKRGNAYLEALDKCVSQVQVERRVVLYRARKLTGEQ